MAVSLASLPVELLENILVHALAGENPSGQLIASLSQTCRYFYNVVYHPDNSHLWYSLFLTVWDDPGRAAEWRSHRVRNGLDNDTESGIDWKKAFVERMAARRTFGALSSKKRRVPRQETIKALRSALDVLSTISPGDFRDGDQPSRSLTAIWSPFSTFFATSRSSDLELSVTGSLPSSFAAHLYPIPLRISELSQNSGWISSVVLSGRNGASQDSTPGRRTFYPRRLLSDHILSDDDGCPTYAIPLFEPKGFWDRKLAEGRREEETEVRLFSQLIFLMGSGPISTSYPPSLLKRGFTTLPFNLDPDSGPYAAEPSPGSSGGDEPAEPAESSAVADDDDEDEATEPGTPPQALLAVEEVDRLGSVKSDYDRARQRARARVYDMRYLLKERSWGPFEVHDAYRETVEIREGKRREKERKLMERGRRARAREDFADMGWIPAVLQHFGVLAEGETLLEESDEEEGEGEGEEVLEMDEAEFNALAADDSESESGTSSSGRLSEGKAIVKPGPHQYEPDFAYLAACRIVIEANLRERGARTGVGGFVPPVAGIGTALGAVLTTPNEGEAIKLAEDAGGEDWQISLALEMLRAGSAPGYQEIVLPLGEDTEDGVAGRLGVDEKGKGKMKETGGKDSVDGWDWAGVEGEWRRVVCFLDYRDLLLFNMQREDPHYAIFLDQMDEAIRIIPMNLKITHYSSPPPRPSSEMSPISELAYRLPVIHFEGHSQGSDTSLSARRRVSGSVMMCEGGWVRWNLYSHNPDDDRPEWASENIQIGDVGSAMGFIGLWTGANHVRNDPLGPSWAWKVS